MRGSVRIGPPTRVWSDKVAYDNSRSEPGITGSEANGAEAIVHRLRNLFGKWCRPNYNSVVATFCHNIANDLPIQISDPANVVDLTYVDDVVAALVGELDAPRSPGFRFAAPLPSHAITLGELAETLRGFRAHRSTLRLPDYGAGFRG